MSGLLSTTKTVTRSPSNAPLHKSSSLSMAVLSKPGWSALPKEIEQMIFLQASREKHELARYILVAHRVKIFMEPILYRKISIYSEANAEQLIYSLTQKSKEVLYLSVSMAIHPSVVARLLRCCPLLVNVVLCGCNFRKCGKVIQALNHLAHLKFLSVDPASLFQMRYVYLPNASVLHRVTHLDITAHWTSEAIIIGFRSLISLTHLSLTWKQARRTEMALQQLLLCRDLQMIVVWRDEFETHPVVVADLLRRRIEDPRIVLLCRASRWSIRVDGGFWIHAARIIAWRKQRDITTIERPSSLEGVPDMSPGVDYPMFPWESRDD